MKRSMESNPDLSPNPTTTKKSKFKPISTRSDSKKLDSIIVINNNFDFNLDSQFSKLDENLLYEVFKHADAKTLAVASCVSKQWYKTALDERLWELICTRHWSNFNNCGTQQLRSVVLALGGFRRLHALYLSKTEPLMPAFWPISPSTSSSAASSSTSTNPARVMNSAGKKYGKDEINLSLSLLSIRFYENLASKKKQ
ncbi:unnamed protein product [Amaranthus hypochondriacus]